MTCGFRTRTTVEKDPSQKCENSRFHVLPPGLKANFPLRAKAIGVQFHRALAKARGVRWCSAAFRCSLL